MTFDINKSLSDIASKANNQTTGSSENQARKAELAMHLKAISEAISGEFENTIKTEAFRGAIVQANNTDTTNGVIGLIKDAHQYLLDQGRLQITKELSAGTEEQRVFAELLLEDVIGKLMFRLGSADREYKDRLQGIDQHPTFTSLQHMYMTVMLKSDGVKDQYPQLSAKTQSVFKETLVGRAYSENEWNMYTSTNPIHNIFQNNKAVIDYLLVDNSATPHIPASTPIWPIESRKVVDNYIKDTANKRREMNMDPSLQDRAGTFFENTQKEAGEIPMPIPFELGIPDSNEKNTDNAGDEASVQGGTKVNPHFQKEGLFSGNSFEKVGDWLASGGLDIVKDSQIFQKQGDPEKQSKKPSKKP